jgi:hypothetical protein
MDQEQRVDRNGGNPPGHSEKPNVVNRALRAAGGNPPPAPSPWIRNVNDYARHESKTFAVMRFG